MEDELSLKCSKCGKLNFTFSSSLLKASKELVFKCDYCFAETEIKYDDKYDKIVVTITNV